MYSISAGRPNIEHHQPTSSYLKKGEVPSLLITCKLRWNACSCPLSTSAPGGRPLSSKHDTSSEASKKADDQRCAGCLTMCTTRAEASSPKSPVPEKSASCAAARTTCGNAHVGDAYARGAVGVGEEA